MLMAMLHQLATLWPNATVVATIAHLLHFLRFQQGPEYKPAAAVPSGFDNLPYLSVTRDQQLVTNVQLEILQRVAICIVTFVHTIALFTFTMMITWSKEETPGAGNPLQLILGILRSLTLVIAWMSFLNRRRSSRPATHSDLSLWLYRLSMRGSAHLEFWLTHIRVALVELIIVVLQYRFHPQQSLADLVILAHAVAYAMIIGIIAIYQLRFLRQKMVPILGGGVVHFLTWVPVWLVRAMVRFSPDMRFLTTAYQPTVSLVPNQPMGVSWNASVTLQREIEMDEIKSSLLGLLYMEFWDSEYYQEEDTVEVEANDSVSEPFFFFREIKTYSLLLPKLFFDWRVYSSSLILLALALGLKGTDHFESQALRYFEESLVTRTATITSFMCYYYLPSQFINNIVPTLFNRLKVRFNRGITAQWKHRVYSHMHRIQQQSSKVPDDPDLYFDSYVGLATDFRDQILKIISTCAGSFLLITSVWQSVGPEILLLLLTHLFLSGLIYFCCRLVDNRADPQWYVSHYGFHWGISDRLYRIPDFRRLSSEQYEYQQIIDHLPKHLQQSGTTKYVSTSTWDSMLYRGLYYPWMVLCVWKFHAGEMSQVECLFAMSAYKLVTNQTKELSRLVIHRLRPTNYEAVSVSSLHRTLDIPDDAGAPPVKLEHGGHIEFRNVAFAYEGHDPVLRGIDLHIQAGRTTAIVGVSGHGKSTMLNLIMRMAEVSDGAILIDGQDIRRVAQGDLRSQIAYVNQSFVTFPGTIYYNIAYGSVSRGELASKDEVVEAAKAVNLYDTIMERKDGFNAKLNRGGNSMSGGELQRMGIARALVRKSPILLLDEATAALDTATETKIMDYIRNSKDSRTTVIIAHRISTIMDADQIVVLDHGKVAELGTHSELVAKGGIYANMWVKTQISDVHFPSDEMDEAIAF